LPAFVFISGDHAAQALDVARRGLAGRTWGPSYSTPPLAQAQLTVRVVAEAVERAQVVVVR
jgi:hypothetical protein